MILELNTSRKRHNEPPIEVQKTADRWAYVKPEEIDGFWAVYPKWTVFVPYGGHNWVTVIPPHHSAIVQLIDVSPSAPGLPSYLRLDIRDLRAPQHLRIGRWYSQEIRDGYSTELNMVKQLCAKVEVLIAEALL